MTKPHIYRQGGWWWVSRKGYGDLMAWTLGQAMEYARAAVADEAARRRRGA